MFSASLDLVARAILANGALGDFSRLLGHMLLLYGSRRLLLDSCLRRRLLLGSRLGRRLLLDSSRRLNSQGLGRLFFRIFVFELI